MLTAARGSGRVDDRRSLLGGSMNEAKVAALLLKREGCDFVPEGTLAAYGNASAFVDAVGLELDKLWRADDPPAEKLLTQHRESR